MRTCKAKLAYRSTVVASQKDQFSITRAPRGLSYRYRNPPKNCDCSIWQPWPEWRYLSWHGFPLPNTSRTDYLKQIKTFFPKVLDRFVDCGPGFESGFLIVRIRGTKSIWNLYLPKDYILHGTYLRWYLRTFRWKNPICNSSRSDQMPLTDKITEIAHTMGTFFLNCHH